MKSFILWYIGFLVVAIGGGLLIGYPLSAFAGVIILGTFAFAFLAINDGKNKDNDKK